MQRWYYDLLVAEPHEHGEPRSAPSFAILSTGSFATMTPAGLNAELSAALGCMVTVVGQEFLLPSARRQRCIWALLSYAAIVTACLVFLTLKASEDQVVDVLLM